MQRFILVALTALALVAVPVAVSADSPFVGKSGNFSGSTCPNGNNPHCPPHGK